MDDRRGNRAPRHQRQPTPAPPRSGGWRYHAGDGAHYGDGAMVCLSHTGHWEVYDYRDLAAPVPTPVFVCPTPQDARDAWDHYVQELTRARSTRPSPPPKPA